MVGNRCNVEGEKACVSGDLYACHKNYNPPRAPGVSIYGLTEKVEECSNGCSAGACVPQSCTDECSIATSYQCSGSNLQECRIVNGCKKWVTTETCTKGCANAQCKTCTDACTPGTSYCLNGNLKSCYLPPDAQCYSEIGTVCPLGCSNGACISSVCGNNACESGETQANCSKDCTGAALTMTSPGATEDLSDGIQISATVSQAAKYFEFVLTPLNYIYPGYTYPVSRVNATTSISETIPRSGVFSRGFPAIGPYAFKGRACKTKTGSTFSDCGPWSEKTVQVYYAAPNLPGPANGSTVTLGEIQGGRRLQAEFPYPDGIPAQNTLKIHFNLSWQAGEEQFWPVSCSLPGGVSSLYGSCYASTPIPSPPLGISSAKPKWSAAGQMTYLSLGKLTTFMTNFSPENNFNFKGAPKPRPPTLDGTTSQKEFCDTWWDACKSNLTSPNCKNLKISERCKNTG
ncbi:MAG: hypothetical protein HY394_04820 [Candidatus Diapherotrites archaeon]|nr:hypothetical protein [Candidatus Diapherotrites archaeon]